MLQIIDLANAESLLKRNSARLDEASLVVAPIIADVRARGDVALIEYAKQFDNFQGTSFEIATTGVLSPELLSAVQVAAQNIRAFAEQQLPKNTNLTSSDGRSLGKLSGRLIRLVSTCLREVTRCFQP
ncbi:histidinol dehydrogenase [Acidimicrobiaceae bacterium]|nr:histidinol dehydrogenase [Acidimicrobiaceae bacterium]